MAELKPAFAAKENIALEFRDGFAMTEVLAGTYQGGVHVYRCVLKQGSSVKPVQKEKTVQVLCFTEGTGAVTTEVKAFAVNEPAVFVPDVGAEYMVHAGTELTYTMFEVEQKAGDLQRYEDFHMLLPFFRPLSQATEYVQHTCKTKNCRSFSIIPTKRFMRVLMGACICSGDREGTFEKGHPAVAQWNVPFGKGTRQVVDVEGELFCQKDGDVSYIPAGLDHSLYTENNDSACYFWFEHYVQEEDYLISYPRTRQDT